MQTHTINSSELASIHQLLNSLDPFSYPLHLEDNYCRFRLLSMLAYKLPDSLVRFLTDFKYEEFSDGVCLVRGYQIDSGRILETPDHWYNEKAEMRTKRESECLLLCSAILGDSIGWSTQQNCKIVHDIVPIKGNENLQVGSSTLTNLWWHTEEAFHPYRCDYLALLCLRNDEKVATTYASVDSLTISGEDKAILFEPHFSIYPDTSHLEDGNWNKKENAPSRTPVLFGDYDHPYLCIDPFYMKQDTDNPAAERALRNIIAEIDRNIDRVVLEPGDMLFIDNFRVVHGRDAFKTEYNGKGRWLKRVNITRDLRKSRMARSSRQSRIIQTA
jgi:Fe(II)/alpha-ketoglutarate-dependent arginine beta-hydroxylase